MCFNWKTLDVVIVTDSIYREFVVGESGVEMFKNTFQSGFLSILYSIGSKPLQIWDKEVNAELSCHTLNTNSLDIAQLAIMLYV